VQGGLSGRKGTVGDQPASSSIGHCMTLSGIQTTVWYSLVCRFVPWRFSFASASATNIAVAWWSLCHSKSLCV